MNADRENLGLCVTVGILLLCNYNRVAVIPTRGSGLDACETDGQSKERKKVCLRYSPVSLVIQWFREQDKEKKNHVAADFQTFTT